MGGAVELDGRDLLRLPESAMRDVRGRRIGVAPEDGDVMREHRLQLTDEIPHVVGPPAGEPEAGLRELQLDALAPELGADLGAHLLARREAELRKQNALIRALEEWQRKKQISDEEAKLKIDFVKKYGAKEWEALLKIKLDIENLERKNNEEFQHDLTAVRRVQKICFAVAAVIAYYFTWGNK